MRGPAYGRVILDEHNDGCCKLFDLHVNTGIDEKRFPESFSEKEVRSLLGLCEVGTRVAMMCPLPLSAKCIPRLGNGIQWRRERTEVVL